MERRLSRESVLRSGILMPDLVADHNAGYCVMPSHAANCAA